ncbi:HRDC domain-containing protein [Pseudactinotalea sp. Z1748]|uniref:HRDC domain-containing protein n=1 Tax=Pseudactinotalea sp. Z1748 TaxID=3413027 RepID=UPI003C7B1F38
MNQPQPLTEPSGGVPEVVATGAQLREVIKRLTQGTGPVAIDAERASGYRYGQRAYLVQVRRAGAGTALIDPLGVPDLGELSRALGGTEWVLHAANQDLPSLAEVALRPDSLFDTELAGRLLGRARVGLGTMVEAELGLTMAKEHSAADWSTRPLPHDWLRYAALDVEVLIELRQILYRQLDEAGKLEWALEEFEYVRTAPPPPPRVDPWRRTSGTHQIRDRRGLAVVRELWIARDAAAAQADLAPGRVLPDRAIIAAAQALPKNTDELLALRPFTNRGARRRLRTWAGAIETALELPENELPAHRAPHSPDALPQPRSWKDRNPEAAVRLDAVRPTIRALADELELPQENLLSPDTQRRIAWRPPSSAAEELVAQALRDLGARRWQVEQVTERLTQALATGTPVGVPEVADTADEAPETADEAPETAGENAP